jgi:hypothetical protein
MARTAGKQIGVRGAVSFVADKLDLRDVADADALVAALGQVRAPRVKGSLADNLLTLLVCLKWEVKQSKGGRASKLTARDVLRRVMYIVEHNAFDHAPKVAALVLWLVQCAPSIVEPRDNETSAAYLARLTKAVEKLTRTR